MCIIEAVGVAEVTENSVSQPSTQHIHCFGKHTLLSKKKKKTPQRNKLMEFCGSWMRLRITPSCVFTTRLCQALPASICI